MNARRIISISFLCLLLGNNTSLAGDRTEREMLSIAQSQLMKGSMRRSAATVEKLMEERHYSVYGNDAQGFVIVSRDNSFTPVLAYSDTKFDAERIPCGMQWWLKAISERMEAGAPVVSHRAAVAIKAVEPLCKTTWGQGDPYNFLTPEISGNHAPTGCVATAMSQIMKYFNYPAQGKGSGYYTLSSNPSSRVNEKINTVYEWDKMQQSYPAYGLTDEVRLPVARLMKDAGLATNMEYGSDGSGAFSVIAARGYAYNFSYDSLAMHCYYREFFNNEMWMKTIYSELAAGRPILYTGSGGGTGHAFVFEGCDADGKIYVNWGWNGSGNGYYDIADLTPRDDKGNPITGNYNSDQSMLFGFKCQEKPDDNEYYTSLWCASVPYELTVNGKIMSYKASKIYNYHFIWFKGDLGVFFYNMDGDSSKNMFFKVSTDQSTVATFFGYSNMEGSFFFNKVKAGNYRVFLASKALTELSCQPVRCTGGAPYYNITIDGSNVTISEMKMFTAEEENPTAIQPIRMDDTNSAPVQYFDLQGRKVDASAKGLLIRRQGSDVKKIIVK